MKILIVEDEAHLADGLRFNLEAEGYEAEIAADGDVALARLNDETFDAVVLDVMLPTVDGFEVAKQMRATGDYTPILMLTATRPARGRCFWALRPGRTIILQSRSISTSFSHGSTDFCGGGSGSAANQKRTMYRLV